MTLVSCSTGEINKPNQQILLFKDKDGLYQYDPETSKEKLIFKATGNQVFLEEPYYISGDTLTFGFRGELTFTDTTDHSAGENYYKDYFSVNLKTGNKWNSKKILYEEVRRDNTLKVKTLFLNPAGNTIAEKDTSMRCLGSSATYKGITYNDFEPRFFSKATVGDKSVFSLYGSIYLTHKTDTTLLVKYKGNFDPKFGSGYYQPQLDPTGRYAVFRYLPGFMDYFGNPALRKVELRTKRVSVIKKGEFENPAFSQNGNFLLFQRNEREGENNTWVSDIYILDLATLNEHQISEAYSASWTK